jgi:signal transduction histidine kinase
MTRFFERLLPQSLFGQMLLFLLAGLVVSHAIGAWIYAKDREAAVREVGGLATAQRIVNLTRLVKDAPDEWRHRIVASSSDQNFHVTVLHEKPQLADNGDRAPVADAVRAYLIAQLQPDAQMTPIVVASDAASPFFDGPRFMRHGPMMMRDQIPGLVDLQVVMPLAAGEWLSFATALPQPENIFSHQFIISMLIMAALALLANAAQRLGNDVNAPPIPETGTIETRRASRAFNDMQTRLRQFIDNRTRLLAAVSHDLRTPLTLLRLRTENVADGDEKDKMLATLTDMEAMIGATLQYARDEMANEPIRKTDLTALVQSVVDDMADAGHDVTMTTTAQILFDCQLSTLKRAITNLVDNAVKYGAHARVALRDTGKAIEITVDDDGPGISPDELAHVLQPFYRVEGSRSRDTGGVGLGLAIAQSLIERHGGTLTLSNRASGGLQARVTLPR